MLYIFNHDGAFGAGSSASDDEMLNLTGSLFDVWSSANALLTTSADDTPVFRYEELQCRCKTFDAEWNNDLVGYVLVFEDGKSAQTQTYIEQDRLHADYGETYLDRYTEYDDELTPEQHDCVDEFVKQTNKLQYHYGEVKQ